MQQGRSCGNITRNMNEWSYTYEQPTYGFSVLTRAVRALLFATIAAYVLQWFGERWLGFEGVIYKQQYLVRISRWSLLFGLSSPMLIGHGYLWQIVTYMFVHGGPWHIFTNMLMLFFLGPETERAMGTRRFLTMYFGCGIVAGLGWLIVSGAGQNVCVGASGALFGILGAFAAMFPMRRITLLLFFVLPVTLSARTLAILLAVFAFVSLPDSGGYGGQIAHAAHLAGGICGYIYGLKVARDGFYGRDFAWSVEGRGGSWLTNLRASWRRRKLRMAAGPSEEEVDRVLDKMLTGGFESLSSSERDVLDRASKARKASMADDR